MRIVTKEEILANVDKHAALAAIEDGFRSFARGHAQVGAVAHLGFPAFAGECHVKSAHVEGDDVFTVKLATGFYGNPGRGLPSSNGFMAVISATTGRPLAILQDDGALTDLRTALAGVIATRLCMRTGAKVLGIVGSGIQARLQAELICEMLGVSTVVVWARSNGKATALAGRLSEGLPGVVVTTVESPADLCAEADVIATATASRQAIIHSDWVTPGTHITAVGADAPGKQELDSALFARANLVIADSITQCVAHGEAANAVMDGTMLQSKLVALGDALAGAPLQRSDADITIADLTGVAVQDAAIAKTVWSRLAG